MAEYFVENLELFLVLDEKHYPNKRKNHDISRWLSANQEAIVLIVSIFWKLGHNDLIIKPQLLALVLGKCGAQHSDDQIEA